jgi:hypothetical protein
MNLKKLFTLMAYIALSTFQSAMALSLPAQVSEYLKKQHLLDEGGRPLPLCNADQTGDGDVFVEYTMTNWPAMLDNLASIAPEPRQQELVIRAMEALPGRTYLRALNKLCDLNEKGAVKSGTLEFAVEGRAPKHGFLSNNYQDPQVAKLVRRFQSLLPKNSKKQSLLADILSGKQKTVDQDSIQEEGFAPPVTLPPQ